MRALRRLAALAACALTTGSLSACAPLEPAPTASLHAAVAEPAVPPQDDLGAFVVPIWLDVAPDLTREADSDRVVSWSLRGSADDGIRLMAPTTVRPTGGAPQAAPTDFAGYVIGLSTSGALITEGASVRVDGAFGRRFTITTSRAIPAGLGCWSADPGDCFSIAPGVTLDLVVLAVHGRPLLLWARTWRPAPSPRLAADLTRLLDTITFVR